MPQGLLERVQGEHRQVRQQGNLRNAKVGCTQEFVREVGIVAARESASTFEESEKKGGDKEEKHKQTQRQSGKYGRTMGQPGPTLGSLRVRTHFDATNRPKSAGFLTYTRERVSRHPFCVHLNQRCPRQTHERS